MRRRPGQRGVIAADISASALASARHNAQLNGLEAVMDFVQADVFDLLADPKWKAQGVDYIILDPPAFTNPAKRSATPIRAIARSTRWR